MKKNQILTTANEQRMTSLDIAEVTGKMHNDVLKAIRKMEPAWEKVHQGKFALMQIRKDLPNGGYRMIPVYSLTKTESLYVATKFNDEARARLVKRWYELERANVLMNKERLKEPEQKLLVTEREIVQKVDAIRRTQIADENAPSDGCFTVSQVAEMLQMTVKGLNRLLVEQQVQYWIGGRYKLTPAYEQSGYARDRSFHYYALDGEKKQRKYLVWTAKGVEFIYAALRA
jgi:phage regulator Rha-like protein